MHRVSSSSRRVGFTLVELLVVVAIIVMVITLAVPAVRAIVAGADYPAAVNTLSSLVAAAQATAAAGDTLAGLHFGFTPGEDLGQWAEMVIRSPSGIDQPNGSMDRYIKLPESDTYDVPRRVRLTSLSYVRGTFEDGNTCDANDYASQARLSNFYILFDNQGQLAHGNSVWQWNDVNGNGQYDGTSECVTAVSEKGLGIYDLEQYNERESADDKKTFVTGSSDPLYINRYTGTLFRP